MLAGLAAALVAGGLGAGEPRVLVLRGSQLAANKARVARGDPGLHAALARLRKEAEEALRTGPFSVVGNTPAPPGGDPHDYLSFGPYWWPDPNKPDGRPYIRRDGRVNPESRSPDSDWARLVRMSSAVSTLALAWYFTDDRTYAAHAARLLRTWFLDPATRMNPHLRYGQAIPGLVSGRGIGIIETRVLVGLVDALGLLSSSAEWNSEDRQAMDAWLTAYLDWLQTSKHGRDEAAEANNHGTWYDAQVSALAIWLNKRDLARAVVLSVKQRRIDRQIESDGRQPAELARTRPFFYSIINLQGLVALARMGDELGVDLWHYQSPKGGGLQKALEFLARYAAPDARWPYPDLSFDRRQAIPLLREGATVYGGPCRDVLRRLLAGEMDGILERLSSDSD